MGAESHFKFSFVTRYRLIEESEKITRQKLNIQTKEKLKKKY